MRKLNTADLFAASRLVTKIGLKEDILELTEKATSFENVNDLGFEMIYRIFAKATNEESEKQIYDFLSRPFEISTNEVASLPLDELVKLFQAVIDFPQLSAFFKRAATLMPH